MHPVLNMRKLLYILVFGILLQSCNEYQKALKSEDIIEKFKMGTELFEEGKFSKANKLFIQVVPKYRGRPQAERLMYMYSKTFYEMGDYYTANYQFERFVSAYPRSQKATESAFLAAKSYYFLSPRYSKEQKETVDALEKLQAFINTYPESEYSSEANELVQELDFKLEKKAYEIAFQYLKTVPYTRDYQAAITAFTKFLLDYPGTTFREDAMFYRFDAAYNYAINSVEWRMEERLNEALEQYRALKKAYTESKHSEAADKMFSDISERLTNFKEKVN